MMDSAYSVARSYGIFLSPSMLLTRNSSPALSFITPLPNYRTY
jgi:hypothetical protein